MTTREFGKSGADPMAQAFAAGVVVLRATVKVSRSVRGIRLYDLQDDDGPETIPAAQSLVRSAHDHPGHEVGTRVLVMLLGDGGAFIIGARQVPNENLSDDSVVEPNANVARTPQTGTDDQVIEGNGSKIVFTRDGDVVIIPKRSLRTESNGLTRVAVDGDADDHPVAGAQFLAWAARVDAMLASHDAWINSPTNYAAPTHTHSPQVPLPEQPASDSDMLSERVLIPTGKGSTGGGIP